MTGDLRCLIILKSFNFLKCFLLKNIQLLQNHILYSLQSMELNVNILIKYAITSIV